MWNFKGVMCGRNELSLSIIASFFLSLIASFLAEEGRLYNTKASSWEIEKVRAFGQPSAPFHETDDSDASGKLTALTTHFLWFEKAG